MTTGHEGMSYTEQMLDVLDDFDTDGGFHIKYQPENCWKVTLNGKPRQTPMYMVRANASWGWGRTRTQAHLKADEAYHTAEEALKACCDTLKANDAASRLGAFATEHR